MTLSEIRTAARQNLQENWIIAALMFFTVLAIAAAVGWIPFLGQLAYFILQGLLGFGLSYYFLNLARKEDAVFDDLFRGFKGGDTIIRISLTYLIMAVFTFLWMLLFIIPGIIALYRHSQTYFILRDRPEITPLEAITLSKIVMKGLKGKLLLLHLSFLGWMILSILTFGIGFFFLYPYINSAEATFYQHYIYPKISKLHTESALNGYETSSV